MEGKIHVLRRLLEGLEKSNEGNACKRLKGVNLGRNFKCKNEKFLIGSQKGRRNVKNVTH